MALRNYPAIVSARLSYLVPPQSRRTRMYTDDERMMTSLRLRLRRPLSSVIDVPIVFFTSFYAKRHGQIDVVSFTLWLYNYNTSVPVCTR